MLYNPFLHYPVCQLKKISNEKLIDYLKARQVDAGFIDKLKIAYRPLISPFQDLLQLINEDSKVFDIGCGSGQFALLVAEFTEAKMIYGIEISEKLINNANILLKDHQQKKKIEFQTFDGHTFPACINEYNLVFLIDVMHHVPQKSQFTFLENIYKNISKGTRLIVKDIDAATPLVYFNKIHDMLLSGEIGHELTQDQLTNMLEEIGFSIISQNKRRMYVYPHFTIVAEK